MSSLNISSLKYLYEKRERIDEKIQQYLKNKIKIDLNILCETPITTNNISKTIKQVLNKSRHPWFDFMIQFMFAQSSFQGKNGSFGKNVFIFGSRKAIVRNLQRISEKIFCMKGLQEYCLWVGFDSSSKPKIKDLI